MARRRVTLLGAGLLLTVLPAAAQTLRLDSIPPLPPTIRLYGTDLPTGADLPTLDAPDAVALTLDEAVALALERNPGQQVSALEARRAATDVTRGNAGYGVSLDAGARAGGSRSGTFGGGGPDSTGTGGTGGGTRASTTAAGTLSVGTVLIDGGGRAAALQRLRAEARQFALGADADAEALAYAVTDAFLDVARQTALADAREEAVGVSEDRLRIAAAEVEIGTSAEIDAALALSDLNADRAALLRQRIALAAARATLGGLLALADPDAVTAADPLSLGPALDLTALRDAAVAANRRVRSLDAAEDAADAFADEVRARYRPFVRADAGAGLALANSGFFAPSLSPTLGPTLQYGFTFGVPLFTRGERRRETTVAQIRVRQAQATTADAEAQVRADAARLVAAAAGQRALAALETQNEAIARQNVRVALAQLQFGLITPIDLRLVQLALVDVRTRRVEAVYQAQTAEAALRLLAGELLPPGAALAGSADLPVSPTSRFAPDGR